jgi:rare lipoprotein A
MAKLGFPGTRCRSLVHRRFLRACLPMRAVSAAAAIALSACSPVDNALEAGRPADGPPSQPVDVSGIPDAVPRAEPRSRAGNAPGYVVHGKRYNTLKTSVGYSAEGIASWYGTAFHGRRTSNGEVYDMYAMSAAHRSLPLPTYLEVTRLDNGRRVVVRVNDRGPFHSDRIIDLSYVAAAKLGMIEAGTARVRLRALDPPSTAAAEPEAVYVQLGAFSSLANAQRLHSRLQEANVIGADITPIRRFGRDLYRLRIGPLNGAAELERLRPTLLRLGLGAPQIVHTQSP